MSNEHWSFEKFTPWLYAKADALRRDGFSVDIQSNAISRRSIRLRAEKNSLAGELTVWDDGSAHEAVLDLKSGEFIHEKDGFSLEGDWPNQLQMFFSRTGAINPEASPL